MARAGRHPEQAPLRHRGAPARLPAPAPIAERPATDAAAVESTSPPRATSFAGQHRTDEHREHAPAEPLVVGERVPQPVRGGEHPLSCGQAAEHVVDEVRGEARHATPRARRAEAAPLAGERDQQVGATLTAEAGEAARKPAAGEELPLLALDEARQTVAVAARASFCEKRLEVLVHDAAQHAMLGHARPVAVRVWPGMVRGPADDWQ